MIELGDLTTLQLLEEHNRMNPLEPLKSWPDGDRKKLIDRLLVLREQEKKRKPSRTIKAAAYELLLEVDYKDHTDRSVGHSYAVILDKLHREFPESTTTDKCLRWYAVQLNADQAKVPWRPRRTPVRKVKPATSKDLKDLGL